MTHIQENTAPATGLVAWCRNRKTNLTVNGAPVGAESDYAAITLSSDVLDICGEGFRVSRIENLVVTITTACFDYLGWKYTVKLG